MRSSSGGVSRDDPRTGKPNHEAESLHIISRRAVASPQRKLIVLRQVTTARSARGELIAIDQQERCVPLEKPQVRRQRPCPVVCSCETLDASPVHVRRPDARGMKLRRQENGACNRRADFWVHLRSPDRGRGRRALPSTTSYRPKYNSASSPAIRISS